MPECSNRRVFQGKLKCGELLNIRETAQINGEISTDKLMVQSGAIFNVVCNMGSLMKAGQGHWQGILIQLLDEAGPKTTRGGEYLRYSGLGLQMAVLIGLAYWFGHTKPMKPGWVVSLFCGYLHFIGFWCQYL